MKIIKLLLILLTLFACICIYMFSSEPREASNNTSIGVTEKIVDIYVAITGQTNLDKSEMVLDLNKVVRKYAHFTLYTVLGTLSALTFGILIFGNWRMKSWVFAFIFCVIYAISDELHQLFVPGRGCQLRDILIDSSGALLGSGIVFIIANKLKKAQR